jgi:hypothetical protein
LGGRFNIGPPLRRNKRVSGKHSLQDKWRDRGYGEKELWVIPWAQGISLKKQQMKGGRHDENA